MIAELRADHRYRSLYLLGESRDGEKARLLSDLFVGDVPVGQKWAPLDVGYRDMSPAREAGCCDDCTTYESPESDLPIGDFPHCWGINLGVFNSHSYAALRDLLAPYVEFLPLHSSDGEFFAFKVLRFIDALNKEESKIEWFPQLPKDADKPRAAHSIQKYVFNAEAIRGAVIFAIPEMAFGQHVFVTDEFIRAVESHHLNGFSFKTLWPPVDDRQRFLEKRANRRSKR